MGSVSGYLGTQFWCASVRKIRPVSVISMIVPSPNPRSWAAASGGRVAWPRDCGSVLPVTSPIVRPASSRDRTNSWLRGYAAVIPAAPVSLWKLFYDL